MKRFLLRRPTTQPAPAAVPNKPKPDTRKKIGHGVLDKDGLNPKQALFLRHYLILNNATQAAIKAGYPAKSARSMGSQLLTNLNIAKQIEAHRSKQMIRLEKKFEVTSEQIVAELAKMGFANMDDFMVVGLDGAPVLDLSKASRDQRGALQEVTIEEFKDGRSDQREVRRVKFKLADKQNALMLLGKNLGLFVEKHDHKHDHQHTLIGVLLDEIDAASRGAKVVDAKVLPPSTGDDK